MRTLLIIALLLILPSSAGAATLYFSPASGTQTVGKAFTVNVYVSSADQAMNAVSADVAVDTGAFTIVSASSVGSVVNFWVEQPTVSGATVSFEGVVLNPGYQGAGAKVASIVLMPKKAGTGTVSFSSASVLANDGKGTELLTSAASGSYTVAAATPPAPKAAAPEEEEEPEEEEREAAPASVPEIIEHEDSIMEGELAVIRGVSAPDALVEVLVYEDDIVIATVSAMSDAVGAFTTAVGEGLSPGIYAIRARMAGEEGMKGAESAPLPLQVRANFFSALESFSRAHLATFGVIALALIALVAVLHAYGFRRLFKVADEMAARHEKSADMTARVFSILKKDLDAHVSKIRAAADDRLLTKEEIEFLADFEDELAEAEEMIAKGKRPRKKR